MVQYRQTTVQNLVIISFRRQKENNSIRYTDIQISFFPLIMVIPSWQVNSEVMLCINLHHPSIPSNISIHLSRYHQFICYISIHNPPRQAFVSLIHMKCMPSCISNSEVTCEVIIHVDLSISHSATIIFAPLIDQSTGGRVWAHGFLAKQG